ncbi:MAG: DUF5683 domain-containing protein [Balneolaceae bacterium]
MGFAFYSLGWSQSYSISPQKFVPVNFSVKQDTINAASEYPDPKKVLYQSLMIPGWGQITNKQVWKVPIVYGLLGGLSYYSVTLHKNYHDHRAAFYNLNPETPDDLKFGPTPDYIPPTADLNSLRNNRNYYRNRRDFIYITIVLAYALNAIDAYVFAHLRSFDVSDDLSMNAGFKPSLINTKLIEPVPSISLSIQLRYK